MEKIKVSKVVIVEGKYDKIKLSSIIDGVIIQTDGFRIYKDKEKISLIRAAALKNGVIIITDSDVAGFKLRSFIRSIAKDADVVNIYIPQILGKEKRKETPSKENLLGVEGINATTLRELFINADNSACNDPDGQKITKLDFFEDGLSGTKDSSLKRQKLLKLLSLPCYISANSLLEVINLLMSYDEYKKIVKNIEEDI